MQKRVLTYRDLKPQKGIPHSRPSLKGMIDRGEFPPPFPLSERVNVWFEDEIDAWLRAKREAAEEIEVQPK